MKKNWWQLEKGRIRRCLLSSIFTRFICENHQLNDSRRTEKHLGLLFWLRSLFAFSPQWITKEKKYKGRESGNLHWRDWRSELCLFLSLWLSMCYKTSHSNQHFTGNEHNRSPLLDTLRSNTENTGALPCVARANVNCVLNIQASYLMFLGHSLLLGSMHRGPLSILLSPACRMVQNSPWSLLGIYPGLAWLLSTEIVREELAWSKPMLGTVLTVQSRIWVITSA